MNHTRKPEHTSPSPPFPPPKKKIFQQNKKPEAWQQNQDGHLCPHASFLVLICLLLLSSPAILEVCLYHNGIIHYSTCNLHRKKSKFALDISCCVKLVHFCLGWEGCQQARHTLFHHLQSRKRFQGLLLLSSTQTVDLIIFSLFIWQLNDRIHFHHIFSWHSLNVSPNLKYHDWKPLTNRSHPLWIPQEKKKQKQKHGHQHLIVDI